MLPSLASRITALGAVVILALLALAALLIAASYQTRSSFRWVIHSAEVIETIGEGMVELRDAESGQRGFVLTHNAVFAQSFEERVAGARQAIARVVAMTIDNSGQNRRARDIQRLADQRIRVLREPLDLGKRGRFDAARGVIGGGQGRDLMIRLTTQAQDLLASERTLQAQRVAIAEARLDQVKLLALIGGPFIAILVALVSVLIIRGIRRPVGLIQQAMSHLGEGDQRARITQATGSLEFAGLAAGYNAMADRLHGAISGQTASEQQLQVVNDELRHNGDILKQRGEIIELLGGMAHRMQAARTDDELAQILRVFVPRVLPDIPGALYAHNNSRNMLVPVASWGDPTMAPDHFAPDQCWALRRGQSHFVAAPGCDIVCGHVADPQAIYHCEPLLTGGEVLGVLYLTARLTDESRFRLAVLAENIGSALVNHRLQRGLREQTIRDPLTGLFNRRYMEEALATEIARAARSHIPLSLVMCDVDHFKRFNDEFGHDAGDAVLRHVAAEMRSRFRDGDVVCRFGGEEFTVIAPGTTAAALVERVELVRRAIGDLNVRHAGRALGPTSMSFGLATWNEGMARDGSSLIQAADGALYRAKREGRNRTVVDLLAAA